jgi:nucleosome binding factor SPN SPT16 subunit
MSQKLMNYFIEQMSDVIENDKKITHEKLAEQIEAKLDDGAYWLKFRPTDGVSNLFTRYFTILC